VILLAVISIVYMYIDVPVMKGRKLQSLKKDF